MTSRVCDSLTVLSVVGDCHVKRVSSSIWDAETLAGIRWPLWPIAKDVHSGRGGHGQ